MEVLKNRLKMRNSEKRDDISLRLNVVKDEIRQSKEYDYIIINDDIIAAGKMIESIIMAERHFKSDHNGSGVENEHSLAANSVKSEKVFDEIIIEKV